MKRILILIAALIVGSIALAQMTFRDNTKRVHTEFLFQQIEQVVFHATFPNTPADLADLLSRSVIDWNSCSLSEEQLIDSWANKIRTEINSRESIITLTSSGVDGVFGTNDDISKTIHYKKNGEQSDRPNSEPAGGSE
jgi:hypothetical protein